MRNYFLVAAVVLAVTGCGATNNYLAKKTKTVEYYRIFDIKTTVDRKAVSKAASEGLGRNVNNAQETTPIPSSGELPEKAGRFRLEEPFRGTRLAALAGGAAGVGMRVAKCEEASWTAQAVRDTRGRSGGGSVLRLTACLFPYADGYHLDLYAVLSKEEGGLFQISQSLVDATIGTQEQWTEKTFLDIVRSIRNKTGAEISLLEAEPELSGTPWLD
ncbi:MAG: hypothetical protein FWG26_01930 [Betaproteobacteria bacterium]|nr:hypothetical protein [Betaproteobacteria bacterium]